MAAPLILASASATRAAMLAKAGVDFTAEPARVDEESQRAGLLAEGANGHSVADILAEQKACKVSMRHSGALVIGSDQVLELDGKLIGKPDSLTTARDQLVALRGKRHALISAVVLARDGRPVWRSLDQAELEMRAFSDEFLDAYLARNWPDFCESVGGYKIEAEGLRLFSRIEGSHFTILGMPLLDLLLQLTEMSEIPA